jgi:hypothetical protein
LAINPIATSARTVKRIGVVAHFRLAQQEYRRDDEHRNLKPEQEALFLVELPIFGEAQEKLLQSRVSLLLSLPDRRLQLFEFLTEALALMMLGPAKSKKHCQRNHQKRKHDRVNTA